MTPNPFLTQRQVLRDVGQCIYCGTKDGALLEEHIVPFALNGSWVLLRASCTKCADITSAFEAQILQHTLLPARVALGLRTRRKKKRPVKFTVQVEREGGKLEPIQVPISDYPASVLLPMFMPPACIDHRPYTHGVQVLGWQMIHLGELPNKARLQKYNAEHFVTEIRIAPGAYARLFAKIAHGMMVAKYGLYNIAESYVLPSILGKVDEAGRWVGSASDKQLTSGDSAHTIALDTSTTIGEIICRVSLFTLFNSLEYIVVTGKVTQELLRASGY